MPLLAPPCQPSLFPFRASSSTPLVTGFGSMETTGRDFVARSPKASGVGAHPERGAHRPMPRRANCSRHAVAPSVRRLGPLLGSHRWPRKRCSWHRGGRRPFEGAACPRARLGSPDHFAGRSRRAPRVRARRQKRMACGTRPPGRRPMTAALGCHGTTSASAPYARAFRRPVLCPLSARARRGGIDPRPPAVERGVAPGRRFARRLRRHDGRPEHVPR
jgi:hypothetical protein